MRVAIADDNVKCDEINEQIAIFKRVRRPLLKHLKHCRKMLLASLFVLLAPQKSKRLAEVLLMEPTRNRQALYPMTTLIHNAVIALDRE